jgi:4-amino-4-deoxy-L-arabinose transferase-like glycosyltransferase
MLKKSCFIYFCLGLVMVLALVLRLYKIDIPLADHHSWRQADTAAVARNFVKEKFDFFHPRIDNMAPLRPGTLNEQRYFLVEPPFYQAVVAGFYRLFGVKESLARLVSILFSLGALVFLFLLVSRLVNSWVGLLSAFFMAVLPYSIFYSRVIMPESMMLFAALGMLWFFWLWLEKKKNGLYFWVVIFTAWALLMKTFPLFLILPMLYLVWQKYKWGFYKEKKLWLLLILSVLPLLAWRFWISHFPEGIPTNIWLFNEGGIRFRPAFFRWIFAERIGKLILGYWGIFLFALGLILRPSKKEGWFFHLFFLSFLIYVSVFAFGNVTHDYYQIPFIPIASVFLAKGAWFLLTAPKQFFRRSLCLLLLAVSFVFMIGFSWFEIRGFYLIQGGVDVAGQAVNELTSKEALVLTGDSNDVTLLYNTNRHGWTGGYASYFPNSQETLEKIREMGGTVYVTTQFEPASDFGQYLLKNYEVLKQTDQYIIFSL